MRFVLFLLALATVAPAMPAAALDWYGRRGQAPSGDRIYICHGYTCAFVEPISLSRAEIARIAGRLAGGTASAAGERQALSAAIQAFERLIGKRAGTAGDRGRTQVGAGERGQMDCIDEATNTSSLLTVLAAHGYLKHHVLAEPATRGFFVDLRYPHATAVIRETASGERWAIDSWPRANGEPPAIQPLQAWRSANSNDPLPPEL